MSATKSYPDFFGDNFGWRNWRMRLKDPKVIPTFSEENLVFISFLSQCRDNQKVGITNAVIKGYITESQKKEIMATKN